VVCPSRDAVEPAFKQLELGIGKAVRQSLQQENAKDFFFEKVSAKKLIADCDEKFKIALGYNLPAKLHRGFAQSTRVPAARLDFFLEKPLHLSRVLWRSAFKQQAADFGGGGLGRAFHCLAVAPA
jgi:hypothetical protein